MSKAIKYKKLKSKSDGEDNKEDEKKAKKDILIKRFQQKKQEQASRSFLQKFIHSEWNDFQILKFTIAFPFGLLLAYGIYKITLENLRLPTDTQYRFGMSFILLFSIGFATSISIRCIACLLVPIAVGESGRIYFYTFILSLIITGPVSNMINNSREVVRALVCGFNLIVNHTKTSIGIRVIPLIDVMIDVQKSHLGLINEIRNFVVSYSPIREEVMVNKSVLEEIKTQVEEDDIDLQRNSQKVSIEKKYRTTGESSRLKRIQKEYQEKVEIRCHGIISDGIRGCKQSFYDAEVRCHNKLPVIGLLLCLPLKLTFLCNLLFKMLSLFGVSCDAIKVLNGGFSDDYNVAEQSSAEMAAQFEANMQYEVGEGEDEDSINMVTTDEVELVISQNFKYREKIITFWLEIFRRLLPFLFLIVVYSSQAYHEKFTSDITYDNAYVTSYFKHIDGRRQKLNKRTLLPLKKMERMEVNEPFAGGLTNEEFHSCVTSTIWIFTIAFSLLILLLVDHAFATILAFITKHSRIDYVQEGKHHIALSIMGTGIIAKVVRTLLVGFNKTHTVELRTSNMACLPHPTYSDSDTSVNIYLVLATIWLFHLLEGHARRLRHMVPAFFYRKRQKKRVLHLYNDMLRRRVGFLHQARHRVRRRIKTSNFHMSIGFFLALRYTYPPYFEWLKWLGLGRQRCLICKEKESKDFVHCPTFQCKATYCAECWKDVNYRCYACKDDDDWSISSGGDSALDKLDMQKKLNY